MFATLKTLRVQAARTIPPSRRNRRFDLRPSNETLERRDLMAVGLDPTFGLAGTALVARFPSTTTGTTSTNIYDNLSKVAMQADGKIIAVGSRSIDLNTTSTPPSYISTSDTVLERFNPDGSLDTSFGNGGTATYTAMTGTTALDTSGVGIVVQSDGKIVVLSSTSMRDGATTSVSDFAVARFNSNGSLDPSFNGTGYLLIDFTPAGSTTTDTSDTPSGIAIAPGGKVVVAGSTYTPFVSPTSPGSQDMAVARIGADGKLDPTFGTGGKAVVAFDVAGFKSDSANAVAVDANGRVIVVGSASSADVTVGTSPTSSTDIAVAALTPGGVLDTSFGTGGKVVIPYDLGGSKRDEGTSVLLSGDKVLIGGTANQTYTPTFSSTPDVSQFTVTRLNANGTFDTSFAGTGKFASGLTGGAMVNDSGVSLAMLSDSSLLVAGQAYLNSSYSSATFLANVMANGGLNGSYGKGGVALLPGVFSNGIAVQPDGKVVIATYNGLVRTTAPTPKVLKAELITTGNGKKAKGKTIKIKFNTGLNPNLANKKTGYQVRIGKRGKRFLDIRKVSYDANTFETTILLKQNAPKKALQVLFTSLGIAGADDQLLNDGNDLSVDVTPASSTSPVATKRHKA